MRQKTILRISAVISGISGIVILAGILLPIFSYEKAAAEKYSTFLSPIPQEDVPFASSVDYTLASNWFVGGAPKEAFINSNIGFYNLSIPKLEIENATVAIGGEDLSKSLIQYPSTALPGKPGNSVIFGHSILPLFYDPKKYIAIFSKLPTLKTGDEIFVTYDGVSYKYRIEKMFEVTPSDLEMLKQDTSDSFLTLVTCTPPGDPRKPRRLIVKARVVPPEVSNANIRH